MSQPEFFVIDHLNASPDTQELGRVDHDLSPEQGQPSRREVDVLALEVRSQGKTLDELKEHLCVIRRLLGGLGAPSNPDLRSRQVILRPRIVDFVTPGATGYSGAPTAFSSTEGPFESNEDHLDRGIFVENPRRVTGEADQSLVDLSVGSPGSALPSEARPWEELSVAQALLQMGQPRQTIREVEASLPWVGPVSRGASDSMVTRGRGLFTGKAQIGRPQQSYIGNHVTLEN